MNTTDHTAAEQRIRAAITARTAAGCCIRFDPRHSGGYDPTPDLGDLGITYTVVLCRGTDGRAWFEARFKLPA